MPVVNSQEGAAALWLPQLFSGTRLGEEQTDGLQWFSVQRYQRYTDILRAGVCV